jgi:hypothetical protein
MMRDQCTYVYRSGPLLPERFGSQIGGVSMGRCQNKCVPGLVVCLEHANKDALLMMIQHLNHKLEEMVKL